MRQSHAVAIAQPVPEVFAFAADPANAPRWAEGIEELTTLDEKPGRVGTTFRMRVKEGGKVATYEGVSVAFEQDRLIIDRVTGANGMTMTMELRFEPEGSGTRVTQTIEVPLTGAMKLMAPLVWLMNRHFQRKQLGKMKELLER